MLSTISASRSLSPLCRKKAVWAHISRIAEVAPFLTGVDSVSIISTTSEKLLQEWKVSIDGAPFSWAEQAIANEENLEVSFDAFSGDFDVFRGTRTCCIDEYNVLIIKSVISYTLGIPVIEENLGTVLKQKMQSFLDRMIDALGTRIEKGCSDERMLQRVPLNRAATIQMNTSFIKAHIVDVGAGGMSFKISGGMLPFDDTREVPLIIAGIPITGRVVHADGNTRHRIIFTPGQNAASLQSALLKLPQVKVAELLMCDVVSAGMAAVPSKLPG